jgi:hypothetical protein
MVLRLTGLLFIRCSTDDYFWRGKADRHDLASGASPAVRRTRRKTPSLFADLTDAVDGGVVPGGLPQLTRQHRCQIVRLSKHRSATMRTAKRHGEEPGNLTRPGSSMTCDNLNYADPVVRSTLDVLAGPAVSGAAYLGKGRRAEPRSTGNR